MSYTPAPKLRMTRAFGPGITPSESRAYKVETVDLLTEKEAQALMRELGSPYQGMKYDDNPFRGRTPAATPV